MIKKSCLLISFIVFCSFSLKKVESLNLFEFALVGIGSAYVADQYFDSSLEYTNDYKLKKDVIRKFYDDKRKSISSSRFSRLPINQQLLLIEELENF